VERKDVKTEVKEQRISKKLSIWDSKSVNMAKMETKMSVPFGF